MSPTPLPIALLSSLLLADSLFAQTPENVRPATAVNGESWTIRWDRSDDFNGSKIDWTKWRPNPENFSGWRWDNRKNATVKDGRLHLTLRAELGDAEDEGREEKPQFSSAMLKSFAKGTYGYYEARIQGAELFPGASPAFWLYSDIDDSVVAPGEVRYSEIDIVELTQRQAADEGNVRIMDHNLHAILSNGKRGLEGREWRRPNRDAFREAQANEYHAPFDPRAGFHTYGCRVDPEQIIWYVDGVEVGRKPNTYWHRPMHVALSLGVRAPYVKWENNKLVPGGAAEIAQFPTSMQVDYVRVWERGAP